ncbi:FAD-dependent oxidoreductase [Streptomyces sp. adm13(2018)]|nr:FAD-dependent oxidoreductase [Streptomyces sp. adm13(2018)]
MNQSLGAGESYWTQTASMPSFAPLAGPGEADVAVVGGGIAGISTARELARSGKSVAVLERERWSARAANPAPSTAATKAHCTPCPPSARTWGARSPSTTPNAPRSRRAGPRHGRGKPGQVGGN